MPKNFCHLLLLFDLNNKFQCTPVAFTRKNQISGFFLLFFFCFHFCFGAVIRNSRVLNTGAKATTMVFSNQHKNYNEHNNNNVQCERLKRARAQIKERIETLITFYLLARLLFLYFLFLLHGFIYFSVSGFGIQFSVRAHVLSNRRSEKNWLFKIADPVLSGI